MKQLLIYIIIIALPFGILVAGGHLGNPLLLEGCGSCHVGHGVSNEPMLEASEEEFCYKCHGGNDNQSVMKSSGRLAYTATLHDIEREFEKRYRHPVDESSNHSPTELLPRIDGSPADHAECVDCHSPHSKLTTSLAVRPGVSGYSASGQYLEEATAEYEICLKCHADNEGLRNPDKNIRIQFDASVRSMHPVTRTPSGRHQTSLSTSLSGNRMMKCSDCHTNDNSDGPKGPHGSNYRFLLSGNYEIDIYADESPFAYQFCYSCHNRESILNNESFPYHREHIVGDPIKNVSGTSCYTCHGSHSSESNQRLISFNKEAVTGSQLSNRIDFRYNSNGTGECSLTCHNHSHDAVKY